MIFSISWKNVWRSKTRSMVVICAVTLGTIAGVFTAGLVKGWVEQRVHTAIHNEVAHVKLYNPEFLNNEEVALTIPDYQKLKSELDRNELVVNYSSRLKVMAMANTSRGSAGMMINGIDKESEMKVSELYQFVVAGNYFETEKRNQIVLSDKTAEQLRLKTYVINELVVDSLRKMDVPDVTIAKLEAISGQRFYTDKVFKKELGLILKPSEINKYGKILKETSLSYRLNSKVVITFTGIDEEIVYSSFRVAGVYKTTNTAFDGMNAFVLKRDLAKVGAFGIDDCHEVAILSHDMDDAGILAESISGENKSVSALTWKNMAPDVAMMSDFMVIWYYVVIGFILFALAFGIINTMLMAILERVKELGMLMAIGMNKKRVFRMIMLETIMLTLVGAFVGMGIGALLIDITGRSGINMSSVGEGFEAIGFAAVVYPQIEWFFFIGVTALVILTGIISSIVPARKALSLNPVEALRSE